MGKDSTIYETRITQLPPLITTRQAAALLSCSPQKVTHMCREGQLKAARVGSDWRINSAALLKMYGLTE